MANHIRLHKGLDVPIIGKAEPKVSKTVISEVIAIKPTDFKGITPRLLVKEGDSVKAGSPLFSDKLRPDVIATSPCSGVIEEIVRGDKRKLLEIRIKADSETDYIKFNIPSLDKAGRGEVIKTLLESGLWLTLIQRPYGITPNPEDMPKAIFISGFNTAPLAADLDYVLKDQIEVLQTGINALAKLTPIIHIGLDSETHASTPLHKLSGVEYNYFHGKHPAGNVGVHIHHVSPISKGEVVWTIDMHLVTAIGKLFEKGIVDLTKLVAVTGPSAVNPSYIKCLPGMPMKNISEFVSKESEVRYVSGNVLTGTNVGANGSLGFFDNQITLLPEGNYYEMIGWAKVFRPKKFSVSRSYFSWLLPKKKYNMDTNLNGGVRAFVMNDVYNKVLPMDIYVTFLLKAILAEEVENMEKLGIYEIIEEDLALCEYVCPSKIDIQDIVRKGLDFINKEMA